jgi:hypothetical protein
MIRNEGTLDRIVRAVLAVVALVVAFAAGLGTVAGVVALVVGLVLGVTAATGFCPLYRMCRLSTCRTL